MNKIGLFFGTETGTTRLIAKKMQKQLGDDVCDKPVNVNRITPDGMLKYDALILGTPSYGIGEIPGKGASSGCFEPNWEEFLALLPANVDFSGKRIAFFGLGAQERYAERFCSSLFALVEKFKGWGAEIVGDWPTDGYTYDHSAAEVDGRFIGLLKFRDLNKRDWVLPQQCWQLQRDSRFSGAKGFQGPDHGFLRVSDALN